MSSARGRRDDASRANGPHVRRAESPHRTPLCRPTAAPLVAERRAALSPPGTARGHKLECQRSRLALVRPTPALGLPPCVRSADEHARLRRARPSSRGEPARNARPRLAAGTPRTRRRRRARGSSGWAAIESSPRELTRSADALGWQTGHQAPGRRPTRGFQAPRALAVRECAFARIWRSRVRSRFRALRAGFRGNEVLGALIPPGVKN